MLENELLLFFKKKQSDIQECFSLVQFHCQYFLNLFFKPLSCLKKVCHMYEF